MTDDIYYEKYKKYKTKYLLLKNKQNGGNWFCDKFCNKFCNMSTTEGIISIGTPLTTDYKIYIGYKLGDKICILSPFHGINLYPDYSNPSVVNMIIEIPQGTQEKMEINKEINLNPLMYDIRDNKIRLVSYQAKYSAFKGYPFHYGALPMTWEQKNHIDARTGKYGDNDPIDAFDISSIGATSGTIKQVKILGAFAMIDGNETDWKLICIDINDPNANTYNDINDVPKNILESIDDFLTNYKTPEGKGPNSFAAKKIWNKFEAIEIVKEVHRYWFNLVNDKDKVLSKGTDEQKKDILKIKTIVEIK